MGTTILTPLDADTMTMYRPYAYTDSNGNVVVDYEKLLYWKAGSRAGMDPLDTRVTALPGNPDLWIFCAGVGFSRDFDPDVDLTYDYDGVLRTDPTAEEISDAYMTGYQTWKASKEALLLLNPALYILERAEWLIANPPSNDTGWTETAPAAVSNPPTVPGVV